MNKFVKSAGAFLLAAVLGIFGAQSASAVTPGTMADGNVLLAFPFDGNVAADLVSVDPVTGLTTQIGTSELGTGWSGASYNPADGQVYVIRLHDWNDPYTLYSVDPGTGEFTEIADLPGGVSAGAIAIDADGNAYLIDWDERVYSFDLTDASVTLIGSFTASAGSDVYAFAINPVDGRAYAFGFYGDGDLLEINLDDGSATVVAEDYDADLGYFVCALAFDSNGTAWFQVEQNQAELWSGDINDLAATAQLQDQFFNPDDSSDNIYTEALAIVTSNAASSSGAGNSLAETGVPAGQMLWTGALACVAVATGAVAVARRKRG